MFKLWDIYIGRDSSNLENTLKFELFYKATTSNFPNLLPNIMPLISFEHLNIEQLPRKR